MKRLFLLVLPLVLASCATHPDVGSRSGDTVAPFAYSPGFSGLDANDRQYLVPLKEGELVRFVPVEGPWVKPELVAIERGYILVGSITESGRRTFSVDTLTGMARSVGASVVSLEDLGRVDVANDGAPVQSGQVIRFFMRYEKPWILGALLETLTDEEAKTVGRNTGAVIRALVENSPARLAGLQVGDIIVGIDRVPVRTPQELKAVLMKRQSKNGRPALFDVITPFGRRMVPVHPKNPPEKPKVDVLVAGQMARGRG